MYICKRNSMKNERRGNSAAGQCECIGRAGGGGVAGLALVSCWLYGSSSSPLVHPLRSEPTRKRERERLMAAIRARIKMVGPRQLYRLGSDGRVHCSSPFPVPRQNGRRRARRETETRHPSVFYIKHHPVVLIWQTPSMSSFLNLVNYSNGGKGKPTKSVSSVARRTKLICIMRWQVNRPLAMKKKGIQTRKRKPKAGTKQHSFGKIFK